jgi:hypothetical protein
MTKPRQTYLDPTPIDPTQITASADLRYLLIDTLQTLLQQTNHTLITQLLEDLATYHQILQEHCNRIIILRPPNYRPL